MTYPSPGWRLAALQTALGVALGLALGAWCIRTGIESVTAPPSPAHHTPARLQ